MSEDLPEHWGQITLGEIAAEIRNGLPEKPHPEPPGNPMLRISAVRPGRVEFSDLRYHRSARDQRGYEVRKGDLLVVRYNGNPRFVATCGMVRDPIDGCVYPDKLIRIRLDLEKAIPEFVQLAMTTPEARQQLDPCIKTAAGQHGISGKDLKRLVLRLPPLAEQRRIVARIEVLFTRTRRARADLERIAPLSDRYIKQSRRRAFDEDATWPAASLDRTVPDYTPPGRFDELRDLPPGWRWTEMSVLGDIAGGVTKSQKRSKQPLQMPYLRVANVYADELRLDDVATIQVTEAELERVRLRRGDLLIVEGNGSVEQIGRVAIWDGSVENCGHQNHLIRVRPVEGIPPRFLLHWLMSPYGRSILETVASSSSGLHTLSLSKIAAVPVPVAPTVVADVVVKTLDKSKQSAGAMRAEATRALALLDRLEQGILARAFRGEFVPQDQADMLQAPAVIERITAASSRRGRSAAP